MAALIPLFPLDLVLFPGTPLPLHIFEPRYKEMIGECLAQGLTFGVIRIVEQQGLADVGCTAEIVTVVKEYPDGQLDIVTEGRRRFELVRVDQERSFLRAEVLMLQDEGGARDEKDAARAVQLHAELLTMAGAQQDLSAADPAQLSFYLAGSLPLDLDFKQRLLSSGSERERLSLLATYLEKLIPNRMLKNNSPSSGACDTKKHARNRRAAESGIQLLIAGGAGAEGPSAARDPGHGG